MHPLLDKVYGRATKKMPPTLAGRIDRLRPSYAVSWGGPLNGQQRRRDIVRDIARAVDFDRVIETGTYRGTSTEFFSAVFGTPIETVEGHPRFHAYSSRRLAADPNIRVELGDSRPFLRALSQAPGARDETVFIYLDAHWEDDLPLAEELAIISDAWPRAVVMIDDFEVPDDPGYSFDDYGPGKRLTASYLPDPVQDWTLLYPAAKAADETGARRGSCVLVAPALKFDIASLRAAAAA